MGGGKVLFKSTIIILSFNFLSRVLGLFREIVIAVYFGATRETDAFMVAYLIPYFFYNFIGLSMAAVIIPFFVECFGNEGNKEAWNKMNIIINYLLVFMLIITLGGMLKSRLLIEVFASGFDEYTIDLAAKLTTIMMPSILFMTITGVLGGILNANNIFGPPALGSVILNLLVIISACIFTKYLGINSLVLGIVVGSIFFLLIQIPSLIQVGYRYYLTFSITNDIIQKVFLPIIPVLLVTGIFQIYNLIDYHMASALIEGSISALNYARKLMQLPQGIFVMAVVTAVYPTLSRLASEQNQSGFTITLEKGIKMTLLLAIPGSIGMIVLRNPLVIFLFQRGAFDENATILTSEALLFYLIGLTGLCLYLPLTRAFFALKDIKTPSLIVISTIVIKIILNKLLIGSLKHSGLALATSVSILICMFALAYLLKHGLPELFGYSFFNFLGKTLVSSVIMGIVIYYIDSLLSGWIMAIRLLIQIVLGTLIFFILVLIMGLSEAKDLLQLLVTSLKNVKTSLNN